MVKWSNSPAETQSNQKKPQTAPSFSHVETTIAQGWTPGGSQQKGGFPWGHDMPRPDFNFQLTSRPFELAASPFLVQTSAPRFFWGKHQWSSWKLNLTLRSMFENGQQKTISTISPKKQRIKSLDSAHAVLFFSGSNETNPRSFFSFISKTP